MLVKKIIKEEKWEQKKKDFGIDKGKYLNLGGSSTIIRFDSSKESCTG